MVFAEVRDRPAETVHIVTQSFPGVDGALDRFTETVTHRERGSPVEPFFHFHRAISGGASLVSGRAKPFQSDRNDPKRRRPVCEHPAKERDLFLLPSHL
jgi:hypothetical protein